MDKKPLIGVSICAVVLLILASLTNVVGYQTVQSSNQTVINNEVNQKELLFQTILDLANNKEIQRIILKSQLSRGEFPISNIPVLTKNLLKQMYVIGLILSKIISKSKIHSMVQQYQLINPEIPQEITDVIEKDAILNAEITQLQNFECDCENATIAYWQFPVLCTLLFPIFYFSFFSLLKLADLSYIFNFKNHPICLYVFLLIFFVYAITEIISTLLNCFFIYTPLEINQ